MTTRRIPGVSPNGRGRHTVAGEPLVFHCNHYNYWLQKTLLLMDDLDMASVMVEAAREVGFSYVRQAIAELQPDGLAARQDVAQDAFAELGFGTMDLSQTSAEGGPIVFPTSHYGQCFTSACGGDFARPQNLFDQGFAAGALAAVRERGQGAYAISDSACHSMGAAQGRVTTTLLRSPPEGLHTSCGLGGQGEGPIPPPSADTHVDEAAILEALSGLDFSGNEEGLVPRFGVILTHHFANYYNRISFEFMHKLKEMEMLPFAETLLIDAGYRCAFNTFGGIMTSPEWDAVIKPQCQNEDDWVHGMVATVNALGWGTWRVHELSENKLVVRIFDDYESTGYLGMYGTSSHGVACLARGGVAGIMNLIRIGRIHEKPTLDEAFFSKVFESADRFDVEETQSMAMGHPFTEIVATRS